MMPHLRTLPGFPGMADVRFAHAEGLARGADAEAAGLARAREDIAPITGIAQPAEA